MSTVKQVDSLGQEKEALSLGLAIKDEKLSPKTYACAVRVLLQNWRQGTVGHKGRSDVAFSTKKPWRQKGTGRARAGSARSPIWRKGGVIFGPEARTKSLKLNRKQRQLCLKNLFQAMVAKKAIYCLDCDFNKNEVPKTKEASKVLKGMGVSGKKGVLLLSYDDILNFASFRNIPHVGIVSFDQPNAFDLSTTEYWMFLKKDLDSFKDMVAKWI